MIVEEHQQNGLKESRVELYYEKKDNQIEAILKYIDEWQQIIGREEDGLVILSPQEVYYFEAVDKKCFAYLKDNVYQVNDTLREIESKLGHCGFALNDPPKMVHRSTHNL